jgi:hypothetical protein
MNQDHKADERQWVERFRAAWEGRDEIASIDAGDAPDFAGTLADGRPFGLEVVTLTDQGLAHGGSVLNDKLMPELEAAATAAGVNAIFALHLGEWQERPLGDRDRRRKVIADLVEFARGAGGQERQSDDVDKVDGVDTVTIYPSDDGVHVWPFRRAWGRGVNEIQACITAKDAKAGTYRQRLAVGAPLWLLLVSGTTYANGVSAPPRHLTYDTKFDRVFFLDHWPVRSGKSANTVVELRIRRVPIG